MVREREIKKKKPRNVPSADERNTTFRSPLGLVVVSDYFPIRYRVRGKLAIAFIAVTVSFDIFIVTRSIGVISMQLARLHFLKLTTCFPLRKIKKKKKYTRYIEATSGKHLLRKWRTPTEQRHVTAELGQIYCSIIISRSQRSRQNGVYTVIIIFRFAIGILITSLDTNENKKKPFRRFEIDSWSTRAR